MTAGELAVALDGRRTGSQWMVCCPAHKDKTPSLSIAESGGRNPLVHCHAGCPQAAVVAALKQRGLWGKRLPEEDRRIIAEYDYTDENGRLLYQVVRFEPKDFRPRHTDGVGGWVWKKHPNQVLYRLPEVLESPIVFVVEGERDVEALRSLGFCATTNAGGANAPWLSQYTYALRGREVIIWPDADPPGWKRGLLIARSLIGEAATVRILDDMGEKDATDWFNAGHSEVELIALIEGADHAATV